MCVNTTIYGSTWHALSAAVNMIVNIVFVFLHRRQPAFHSSFPIQSYDEERGQVSIYWCVNRANHATEYRGSCISLCILWFCTAAHHHEHVTQTHAVDPDRNTCTIKVVADHLFFDQVGDSQESTVRILLLWCTVCTVYCIVWWYTKIVTCWTVQVNLWWNIPLVCWHSLLM